MYGYNCSAADFGVATLDLSEDGPPVKPSLMSATIPNGFKNAWPRYTCPTNDDSDGLRFLYPECDELLECETPGGRETTVNNVTGCSRFTPTVSGAWYDVYSIVDYYVPTATNNWSHPNYTWTALGYGRALPNVTCARKLQLGKTGTYRSVLLLCKAIVPPLTIIIGLKLLSILMLYMPFMKAVRKRNEKLQRTAEKRKAEVRRMQDGGHEFAVKRMANKGGQAANVKDEVMQRIHKEAQEANPEYKSEKQKKADKANMLLQATRAKKAAGGGGDAAESEPESEPGAGTGLQGTASGSNSAAAPASDAPAAAWPAGEAPAAEPMPSSPSYAPVSQFASEVKALTAQTVAEEPA